MSIEGEGFWREMQRRHGTGTQPVPDSGEPTDPAASGQHRQFHDRPLVSDEVYVPCRFDDETCVGQVTADRLCDVHRPAPAVGGDQTTTAPVRDVDGYLWTRDATTGRWVEPTWGESYETRAQLEAAHGPLTEEIR